MHVIGSSHLYCAFIKFDTFNDLPFGVVPDLAANVASSVYRYRNETKMHYEQENGHLKLLVLSLAVFAVRDEEDAW